MLTNPTAGRHMAGRLIILATVAVALPLTATRVNYIDVGCSAAPQSPPRCAPAGRPPVAAVAPVAPLRPSIQQGRLILAMGTIHINGQTRRWKDLTPAEKRGSQRHPPRKGRAGPHPRRPRADPARYPRGDGGCEIDQAECAATCRTPVRNRAGDAGVDAHVVDIRRSARIPNRSRRPSEPEGSRSRRSTSITRQALASVDHERSRPAWRRRASIGASGDGAARRELPGRRITSSKRRRAWPCAWERRSWLGGSARAAAQTGEHADESFSFA